MSVETAKLGIKAQLETLATPLERIYTDAAEMVSIQDFPAGLILVAPATDHQFATETMGNPGLVRHEYQLHVYILVGARSLTNIEELHARAEAWIQPVNACIVANLTLSGAVSFLGTRGDMVFNYRIGDWLWGDGSYYGIRLAIPVTENLSLNVG